MTTRLAREEEAANLKLLQEASEIEQLQEEQDSEMVEQQLFGTSSHEVRNSNAHSLTRPCQAQTQSLTTTWMSSPPFSLEMVNN